MGDDLKMAEDPFTPEQRRVLDTIVADDRISKWLSARRRGSASSILGFWASPETGRTLLTAALIPLIAWAATATYQRVFQQAQTEEIEQREEVEEVAKLMPIGMQSDDGRRVVSAVLLARKKGQDSVIAQTLVALRDNAKSKAPPAPRAAPPSAADSSKPSSPATAPTPVDPGILADPLAAPSVVYLQIYSATQDREAAAITSAFSDRFVPVAGTENVSQTHLGIRPPNIRRNTVSIRYYYKQDKRAADYASAVIAEAVPGWITHEFDLSARSDADKVKSGTVEIWLIPAA